MAIIENKETESRNVSGFNKSIEASAMSMMLDNLQIFMYQKPIQSTVRECTSNALDSLKEKKIAIEIVTGQSKVSDYFVEKEGDIYKDSKFDSAYYDTNWLSPSNRVNLTYVNNADSLGRDKFIIEDTGVGLGGIRLEKYFSLGYSSKRLTSQTLGAFGLGNKSPLATGVDSYRIVSRYNGKEYCFDVFSHKVDCVYSKWDESGKANDFTTFSNGFEAYYKTTTEKNGLQILVDVKKHNKNQYIEAVKSQLMYFKDDIVFKELYDGRTPNIIDFKSRILFENDDIIVSDSNYYSRPHFVLKNVSYGAVDFKELELENRHGSIGIKINMEEVDVSPSRENIIYNQKSRDVIVKKYNNITGAVTKMINDSLKTEDVIEWIRACNNIFYGGLDRNNDVLYRLSGMIDKFNLELKHPTKTYMKYSSDLSQFLSKGLKMESVYTAQNYNYKKGKYVQSIKRDDVTNCSAFSKAMYLQFNGGSPRTTKYIISLNKEGFTIIKPGFKEKEVTEVLREYVYDRLTKEKAIKAGAEAIADAVGSDKDKAASYTKEFNKCITQLSDFKESKLVKIYDDSIVPDSFVTSADDEEEEVTVQAEAAKTAEEYRQILRNRKASGKFILGKCSERSTSYNEKFVFSNEEVDNSIFSDDDNIVYGYTKDTDSLVFLARVAAAKYGVIDSNSYNPVYGWTKDLKICKIAQNNKKYLLDRTYIEDYFVQYEKKVMTTSDLLKEYFTMKYIRENLVESVFLTNFDIFDETLAKTYRSLIKKSRNYKASEMPATQQAKLLENAVKFQVFKWENEGADAELIDKMGTQLLGEDVLDEITDVDIIDKKVYENIIWINKFAEVYGHLLGQIGCLRTQKDKISDSVERDIKTFIKIKKDELEMDYPTLNY